MDRLNARLVALLQERARLARRIGTLKARHGLAASDPARERAMLARMLADAPAGFTRRELERVLRAVLTASRRLVVAARE
jgi:chorismate mutase